MGAAASVAIVALQAALTLLLAPALVGYARKIGAASQGRRGPPWLQPYYDLAKLLRKGEVRPASAPSLLFAMAPLATFGAAFAAAMLIPTFHAASPLFATSDLLVVVFLLALARFLTAIAALEPGASFAGFGASREATFGALVEPALVASVFWVALASGSLLGTTAATPPRTVPFVAGVAAHMLVAAALLVVAIAETGRVPVDNPATHLELTMLHEAMVIEHSGPRLAVIEWGGAIKQLAVLSLVLVLVFPVGIARTPEVGATLLGLAAFLAKLLGLATLIGLVEVSNAKWRLFRLPELFVLALALAILGAIAAVLAGGRVLGA